MSLTREQALAAAWLVLAGGGGGGAGGGPGAAAAAPPGGTIAQGAAAANQVAAGGHKGSAAPKKVASGAGAAKYHEPIGALIIPHGKPSAGEHFVHGDPSHMIHGTSEPDWLAHQWKDKEKAREAAEKAVSGGTHHWVQAGEHSYAVHNGLETHVPKDTDVHDEAAVKNAHKVLVKHGEHPEHVMLKPEGPGEAQPHDAGSEHLLAAGYKKLPDQPAKKAVTFAGKHAAWVPHDWQVYHATSVPEGKLGGKFAKDAAGKWHTISAAGDIDQGPAGLPESWSKAGSIVPDEDHPGPAPEHVAPNQGAGGPEKPKADVGGVAVTKEQIHAAIGHLNEDKSTAVKQPLAKKGHPLAAMDYHAVAKAELAAHPELKIPPGTKKEHVGQVKVAVLHHLAGKLDALTASEAESAAAEAAQDKAEAAAVHAQQLTPGTFDVGGVSVTSEDIQAAIGKLQGSTSTQIKGLLKGNPLAGSDYHAVVSEYQAAHPAELQHGTKQVHAPNAKMAFIAALQEKASQAASGDLQSGHEAQAELDQLATAGFSALKKGWPYAADGAVAGGLITAYENNAPVFMHLSAEPGVWAVNPMPPDGTAYFEATPEHKVSLHFTSGESHDWSPEQALEAAKAWIKPGQHVPEPEPEVKVPEPEPKPVWDIAAWKQTPEYQAVHALIAGHPPGLPPHDDKHDTDQQLASVMYLAAKTVTKYLTPGTDGGWDVHGKVPAGIAGTFGMPGKAYYEIGPDHEVTVYGSDGQPVALPGGVIADIAGKWLTPPEPEPEPESDIQISAGGKQAGSVPAGSTVYVHKAAKDPESASKFVRLPDGGWKVFYDHGGTSTTPASSAVSVMQHEAFVKDGTWIPYEPGQTAAPEPEPPEPEPVAEADQQLKTLLINGAVKPSAEFEDTKQNANWVLASVLQRVAKVGAERWALKHTYGGWTTTAYDPSASPDDEWFHVTADLAVTHHADGKDVTVGPEQVSEIAHQMVVPDSVKLNVTGKHSYATEFKMFKHGFYYKPSKQAKAYLEIKPPSTPAGGTTFIYHAPSGDKQVNASYAAKVLADATEYHTQAKDSGVPAAKISYATTVKTGVYQGWSDVEHAPASSYPVEVYADGSLLLGATPVPAVNDKGESVVDSLVKGGSILDQYGTSVVKPGVQTEQYHVFGSEAKTPAELQSLLTMMEQHYGDKLDLSELVKGLVPGNFQQGKAYQFFSGKLPGGEADWQGQRDAVMGLLRELLAVPGQKAGASPGAEPSFLKGLPPGIHDAKDVFAWTDKGYAKPFAGELPQWPSVQTAGDLTAKIKEISAQFGDSKVIGLHISSLSKDQKAAWVDAFKAGDMAKVFTLDAGGGKVSPVHPGAPDNAATHHVTWAPWDESQVPADTAIEGAWSALDVTPTKAEADNYLIKGGLQHAAFLSLAERRQWVKAHRAHDQLKVDELSKLAAQRFSDGSQALSEAPAWTEHVEPAKSYTVFLEDGTPASGNGYQAATWTYQAVKDFVADNHDMLVPFAQQVAQEMYGNTDAQYILNGNWAEKAVQKYLDDKAAKELAEKLRPKYELVPGEPATVTDQHGHVYLWHPGDQAKRLAVTQLAQAWGMKTPKAEQVTLEDGSASGTITGMLAPDAGTLALLPAGIAGLTDRELGDLAREHVFDYALGNPSSTPGDYIRSGGGITGTGKAGAFSDFTWQGADLAGMNAVTVQPVSALFDAVKSGDLSQPQADAAYIAAVRAARRMSRINDARLAAILNDAGVPMDTQLAAFQRVAQLPDAVQGLWDKAYAGQGWTPPEVPVAKLPHGLHSGFSEPEFSDHVHAAKASGVPAFFAGPHLEDGSFLVWTEKAGDNRYLRGESSLRGAALDKAITWAETHQTGGETAPSPAGQAKEVKNLTSWHSKVLAAAKAVSRHAADQMWEGPITVAALNDMATLKTELAQAVTFAEAILSGHDPDAAGFASSYGHPYLVRHAAQYYLDKIAQVEDHKANAQTFAPGEITEWEAPPLPDEKAPEAPAPPAGVKVEYLKATRVLAKAQHGSNSGVVGDIVDAENELQLGTGIYEYPGYAWHVTLPTGEVIELSDEGKTSSPLGQHGRVRFRAIAADGSASLERVRAHLQEMGVPLEEAAPEDMELLYWRSLAGILANRVDRQEGKYAKVWASLGSSVPAAASVSGEETKIAKVIAAGLDPGQELDAWHKAWANLTSAQQVQDWADKGGHLPHLPHLNTAGADVPAGKPYWYRFDVSTANLAQLPMPTHSLSDTAHAVHVATTGALYSTEARLRAEGVWISGASSSADMVSHGSAGVVYTRPSQESTTYSNVWISPRVLARTSTYGFANDAYGDLAKRKNSSHFDLASAAANDTTETDIKDAISLLDDIMLFRAGENRQQVIDALKARGITQIRGLPVEDRILSSVTSADIAKVKAAEPDSSTWFDHPAEPWSPPAYTAAAGEKSIVESAGEKAASEAGTPAEEIAKAQMLAEHGQGAPVETVNQLFYHSPVKPDQGKLHTEKVQIKIDAGKRVADTMKSGTDAISALAAAAGIHVPPEWGPARQAAVGAFVAVWAQTNSSVFAHAMQQAAHTMFGLQKDLAVTLSPEVQAEVDELLTDHGSVIEDFLLTQYALTQQDLQAQGITHLTLYRGFNWSSGSGPWGTQLFGQGTPDWAKGVKTGDTIPTPPSKPFASWAFEFPKDSAAMAEFTGYGPYTIVKTTVPASLVMSYPRSGMASYWQYEFIVLDAPGQWEVHQAGE